MVLTTFLTKNNPPSEEKIQKTMLGLEELDPCKWDDTKIDLYRQSLHRHHDIALSNEKSMKNTSVGMISALSIVVSIICVAALPYMGQLSDSSTTDMFAYDLLIISILSLITAILFFVKVLSNVRKPSIIFDLDSPICDVEETENIGTLNGKKFNATMLRYEVHEHLSQMRINCTKKDMMILGQMFTFCGILLLILSLMVVFGPNENSYFTEFVQWLFSSNDPIITPFSLLIFVSVVVIIISLITSFEPYYQIQRITRSERFAKEQKHSDEKEKTSREKAIKCLTKRKPRKLF